jgi:hypothetical protein
VGRLGLASPIGPVGVRCRWLRVVRFLRGWVRRSGLIGCVVEPGVWWGSAGHRICEPGLALVV